MVLPRFSHRINYAEINLKFQGTSLKGFGKNESKLVVSTQIMYLNKNSNNVSKFAFKLSAFVSLSGYLSFNKSFIIDEQSNSSQLGQKTKKRRNSRIIKKLDLPGERPPPAVLRY
jgi:hypothetical protein